MKSEKIYTIDDTCNKMAEMVAKIIAEPIPYSAPAYIPNEFRPPLTRAQRRKQTRTANKS